MDELYSYDTLGRLTRSERGDLTLDYRQITDLTCYQSHGLDQVGNWTIEWESITITPKDPRQGE